MSIDTSTATKPVARENESVSRLLPWSQTQGSANGHQDGNFSSIWDKAVSGAQKLFGLDKSIEQEDSEESGESSQKKASGQAAPAPRTGPLAVSYSIHRQGIGNLPELNRPAPQPRVQNEERPAKPQWSARPDNRAEADEADRPDRPQRADRRDRADRPGRVEKDPAAAVETDSDDSASSEKVAAPILPLPLVATTTVPAANLLAAASQQLTAEEPTVGIASAKSVSDMPAPLLTPSPTTAPEASVAPVTVAPAPSSAPATVAPSAVAPAPAAVSASVEAAEVLAPPPALTIAKVEIDSAPAAASAQAKAPAQAANGETLRGHRGAQPETPETARSLGSEKPVAADGKPVSDRPIIRGAGEESLSFDPEKAKGEIASALKAARPDRPVVSDAPRAPRPAAQAETPVAEPTAAKPLETAADAPKDALLPKPAAPQGNGFEARQQHGPAQRSAVPIPGAEAQAARGAPPQAPTASESSQAALRSPNHQAEFQVAAREGNRTPDARPLANRPAGPTASPQGAAGVSTDTANGLVQSAQSGNSQRQGADTGAKNDSAFAMKLAQSGKAEKASGEPTSTFSANGPQAASDRKAAAAERAAPTSYSSRTASEVKEIFATMAKGLERLAGGRQDVVTVRIHFDQGGSLSIKLSMDNGQVNTAMQTDLPGLESLIKSNWSELANDSSAKGLKLNQPQFSQGEGDQAKQQLAGNDQRDARQQGASAHADANRQGRSGQQRSARPAPAAPSSSATVSTPVASGSEQELKTYA